MQPAKVPKKNATTATKMFNVRNIGDSKLFEYIRAIHVEGSTRAAAYAKYINSNIYSMTPDQIRRRLDTLKNHPRYDEIRDIVLAEEQDYILRRSATLQNKAMELLVSTMEAAQRRITSDDSDSKDIQAAATVIKSLMPAYQAINQPREDPNAASPSQRKNRARMVING